MWPTADSDVDIRLVHSLSLLFYFIPVPLASTPILEVIPVTLTKKQGIWRNTRNYYFYILNYLEILRIISFFLRTHLRCMKITIILGSWYMDIIHSVLFPFLFVFNPCLSHPSLSFQLLVPFSFTKTLFSWFFSSPVPSFLPSLVPESIWIKIPINVRGKKYLSYHISEDKNNC